MSRRCMRRPSFERRNMLNVGIDSWIIQDGNYPDFKIGESARFALEFYPHSLDWAHEHSTACEHLVGNQYRIRGEIVFKTNEAWVIDFGWLAYQNAPAPRIASTGGWLTAEISIGVDPFFYAAELRGRHNIPELCYEFRVREILLDTTPWITIEKPGFCAISTRDETRRSYAPVVETNAWEDDDGRAQYLLRCEAIRGK